MLGAEQLRERCRNFARRVLEKRRERRARERVPVKNIFEACRLHAIERTCEALGRVREIERDAVFLADFHRAPSSVRGLAVAFAELIKSRIHNSRLEIIADAAHNVTTERPDEVNTAISKFLAELS